MNSAAFRCINGNAVRLSVILTGVTVCRNIYICLGNSKSCYIAFCCFIIILLRNRSLDVIGANIGRCSFHFGLTLLVRIIVIGDFTCIGFIVYKRYISSIHFNWLTGIRFGFVLQRDGWSSFVNGKGCCVTCCFGIIALRRNRSLDIVSANVGRRSFQLVLTLLIRIIVIGDFTCIGFTVYKRYISSIHFNGLTGIIHCLIIQLNYRIGFINGNCHFAKGIIVVFIGSCDFVGYRILACIGVLWIFIFPINGSRILDSFIISLEILDSAAFRCSNGNAVRLSVV